MSSNGTGAVLLIARASERAEAERVGEALVERGLAACGSVVPTVHSFFRSEGRLQREHESLLLLWTSAERSAEAQVELSTLNPNRNVEILEVPISGGSAAYLEWLLNEVKIN